MKVTYEEAMKSFTKLSLDGQKNADVLLWFIEQHKTPTFAELLGKWYSTEGLWVRECSEYIEIYSEWSKTSYYKVYYGTNNNRVWLNPRYSAFTYQHMKLLDLTIRYLEAQKHHDL